MQDREDAGCWTAPVLPAMCRLIAAYGASWKGDSAFLTHTGLIATPSLRGRGDAETGTGAGDVGGMSIPPPAGIRWVPPMDAASQGTRWPRYSRYPGLPKAQHSRWLPRAQGFFEKDLVVLWPDARWVHVPGLLLGGWLLRGSPSQKRKCHTKEAPAVFGSSV